MQNFAKNVDVLTQGLKSGISGLMNLASQGGDPSSGVFFVNFNQDCTSLAVGTKTGYRLFSLYNIDKLDQIYENETEDICLLERLFNSSLVAMVSLSSPRKLKVCHFKKKTEICNYSYSNTILAVKLNRSRLVVCLEESLYIHNIRDMKVLHTIRDTPPNPSGLCTLSTNSDHCFLAYPGSSSIGEVLIFDALNLQAKSMIPAHDSPLAALAFSPSGTKIATASEKGTVIRVFNVLDSSKLFEFRRGVKRCVSIYCLAFSADASFLCCSSNTETVHVFKLDEQKDIPRQPVEETQGWMGYLTKAVSASANYLPTQVTDVFSQGRAFATVHLPFQGLRNVCAIAHIQKTLRLLVAAADGYLYVYNLDPGEGGDCTLLRQHRLDGRQEQPSPVEAPVTSQDSTLPEAAAGGATYSTYAGSSAVSAKAKPNPSTGSIFTLGSPFSVKSRDRYAAASILWAPVILPFLCTPRTFSLRNKRESEKYYEMASATESPPKGGFRLDDDSEFPPMMQKTE